jgi:hypothetical protein
MNHNAAGVFVFTDVGETFQGVKQIFSPASISGANANYWIGSVHLQNCDLSPAIIDNSFLTGSTVSLDGCTINSLSVTNGSVLFRGDFLTAPIYLVSNSVVRFKGTTVGFSYNNFYGDVAVATGVNDYYSDIPAAYSFNPSTQLSNTNTSGLYDAGFTVPPGRYNLHAVVLAHTSGTGGIISGIALSNTAAMDAGYLNLHAIGWNNSSELTTNGALDVGTRAPEFNRFIMNLSQNIIQVNSSVGGPQSAVGQVDGFIKFTNPAVVRFLVQENGGGDAAKPAVLYTNSNITFVPAF